MHSTQRHGRGRMLLLALVALLAGAASYGIGVLNRLGQQAEASVLRAAEFTTNPPPPLNLVSIPSVAVVLILIAGLAWGVHGLGRGISILVTSGVTILASQVLKQSFLERPQLFEIDAENTFPSGHMTVFVVLVGALIWAVADRWRDTTAGVGGVLMAIVAWQLLAYGWHRPSDVFGALALGLFAFALARMLLGPGASRTRPGGLIQVFGIVGAVLVVVGAGTAIAAIGFSQTDWLLFAGEISAAGAAVCTARLLRNT